MKTFRKEAAKEGAADDVSSVDGEEKINRELWVLKLSNYTK